MELRRPKIREPLQDTETTKKNKTVLSAVIVGDPSPDITWCFNGKEMTDEQFEKYNIQLDTETKDIEDGLKECKYTLTIPTSK